MMEKQNIEKGRFTDQSPPLRRKRKVLPIRLTRRKDQTTNPGPPGDRGSQEKETFSQGGEFADTGQHSRPKGGKGEDQIP